ncbi:hypothetical protein SAMN05877753_107192 [Bacillus oleivorans]|uniref:Coupling factor for flagellin transcription and translation n=1 Tax=Bacillus oleivorans TaxID=1448271 RepID=A0A285D337_9BACI|nr:hypothetical protein [Bacillus oleivorans]SNX73726.1 hypothetical protein SAMN05877753_107192 [Bacillus oleivorans]
MTAFFLTISIFLNILCLLALVILFQRQHRLQDLDRKQQHALQEMEDVLSSFLYEIKEENEKLQGLLGKKTLSGEEASIYKPDLPAIQEERTADERGKDDFPEPIVSLSKNNIQLDQVRKAYKETETVAKSTEELPPWLKLEGQPLQTETGSAESLKEQIISLWKEGHTIEAIAKKVDKGKTEVELTLKFYGIL